MRPRQRRHDARKLTPPDGRAFTLIELMAVVLILAILAGVAMPRFFDYQSQARRASCQGTLGGVRAGIATFYANEAMINGTAVYPTLAQLTDGSTMQEAIPENPYNSSADIALVNSTNADARFVAGGSGWNYFDGVNGGTGNAVFYANTNTIGESDF